jgi:undecaprenyl-diphosphatase
VHAWVLDHRTAWLNLLMQAVTWLGANAVVVPLLVTAAIVLRRTRHCWRPVLEIVVVYGTAVLAHALVAVLVHRQRPPDIDWLTTAGGWAYPSGHTIQATVGYGTLLVLLAPGKSPRIQGLMAGAAAIVVLLVGASRLYLGVHWLTDVLGSVSLGVTVLAIWGIARLTILSAGTNHAGEGPSPGEGVDIPRPGRAWEQDRHGHLSTVSARSRGGGTHAVMVTAVT